MKTESNVYIVTEETDILNFVTKSATKEQRRHFNIGDIYINGAVCKSCGDFIRSKNRHDYKQCSCGKVIVDGGSWYCKRGGEEKDRIEVIENFYD